MGPRSTAPFIDLVVTQCQVQYGARHDIDFPKMLICSQPAPFYEDRPVDHEALEAAITEGLQHLERAGADFLAIACNTAHIYYPNLAASVGVELLNIVDLAVQAIPASSRKLALVAARPTAEAGIFQNALRERGLAVCDLGWQDDVDRLLAATRDLVEPSVFTSLWADLTDRAQAAGIDTLLVACLDLSGVLHHAKTPLPMVDAAQCLAEEIVREWLARRDRGEERS
jgi:aspartate racemase